MLAWALRRADKNSDRDRQIDRHEQSMPDRQTESSKTRQIERTKHDRINAGRNDSQMEIHQTQTESRRKEES